MYKDLLGETKKKKFRYGNIPGCRRTKEQAMEEVKQFQLQMTITINPIVTEYVL